jgi:hypothetical protein
MSAARHIGTALTLGGALFAMTALSSEPSEARRAHVKKGHFVGSKSFHRPIGKTVGKAHHAKRTSGGPTDVPGKTPKDPGIGKLSPFTSQSHPAKAVDVVKGPPDVSLAQDGRTPFPKPTLSTKSPHGLEDWPGTKPPKLPPVVGSKPIQPDTLDPGKLPPPPGGKIPPVVSSEPLPGPFDGGKKPPGSGGGYMPPVVVIGGGAGGDAGLPGLPKGDSIVVQGSAGDSCDTCAWLKLNYDQTRLAKWLDRYRLCLTWQRGDQ